jgi:hypothetical protein
MYRFLLTNGEVYSCPLCRSVDIKKYSSLTQQLLETTNKSIFSVYYFISCKCSYYTIISKSRIKHIEEVVIIEI